MTVRYHLVVTKVNAEFSRGRCRNLLDLGCRQLYRAPAGDQISFQAHHLAIALCPTAQGLFPIL